MLAQREGGMLTEWLFSCFCDFFVLVTGVLIQWIAIFYGRRFKYDNAD
jgi:hypothetical protein